MRNKKVSSKVLQDHWTASPPRLDALAFKEHKVKIVYLISITLLVSFANASDEYKSKYIANYIKQMLPVMAANFSKNIPMISKEKSEQLAENLVPKMAECQYESVSHYPKKYWESSIISVSEGSSLEEAASIVDDLMADDLEKGNITDKDVVHIVSKAQEYIDSCLKGSIKGVRAFLANSKS
jgi:hypothetical protein